MVDRALLFCALQADFVDFSVVCYVGLVYPQPHFSLLSRGEAVRDEPAQYISMQAPETTMVVPNGSHYRDSQYSSSRAGCFVMDSKVLMLQLPEKVQYSETIR